jgi:SAM-dependent methyltransferase
MKRPLWWLVRNRREWLQERQYAKPYHWSWRRNNALMYQLRTDVVLDLLGVSGRDPSNGRLRLLDVGCGDARFLGDASRVTQACGVDVSLRALVFARNLVPKAAFAQCSAATLCFQDGTFDAVTLLDVIEHIPDGLELEVMREAHRVLRPGGHVVVTTNTDRTAAEWKHYRHYSLPRFQQLFDGLFSQFRAVGMVPYFPTLRAWLQTPIVWKLFRSRVCTCPPEKAHVIAGIGQKC